MLLKNLLLVVFFIGIALSIPVKRYKRDDDKTEVIEIEINADEEKTVVVNDNNDGLVVENPEGEVSITAFTQDDENKDDEKKEDEKVEEKKEDEKVEEKKEDEKVEDEKVEEKKEDEKVEEKKEEEKKEEAEPIAAAIIPENEEILTEYKDTCTKDHILLGNHVTTDVCNDIYEACTTKELLAVIVYFYSKESPVSIEYTINENMNKEVITEQCATVLVNSKIFIKDTVVLPPVDEIAPVEKVEHIDQDMPTDDPNYHVLPTASSDDFAKFSEDDIDE